MSLLSLAAGAVVHVTGTRDVEKLGGLLKRMPGTAAFFIVGAVAIAGLPPLNGFLGESLIFRSGLSGRLGEASNHAAAVITLVGGLAVIGTLTSGAFSKAVGIVFLGEPRA
jgi:formate hydrogenlyase subunit 3/multisubunit Na+/H+ antiporter MnhD subunit